MVFKLRKIYNWRRFWLPANASVYLEDDAYLPDPTEKYFVAFNPEVADLVKLREHPCKILVGESGMGKSSAIRADFARLEESWEATDDRGALLDIGAVTSVTDLRSEIENHPAVRAWRSSGRGVMNLHLDSLDEAIPAYPAISKSLMTVIKTFGHEQLRLSIACRTGEFPPFLEEELASHFGADKVTRWYLAPLTRGDIQIACADNAIDYEDFMRAVWEPSTSSRSTQGRRLDLDQSMAVAGRVACITVLGARMIVNAETNASDQLGVVTAREVTGDRETANGSRFAVTEPDVVEVLRTGLFTANGLRFRWSHKSYSEFMAAWSCGMAHLVRRGSLLRDPSNGY
jgi:hypothetical protein